MGDRIQVLDRTHVANPNPFLTGDLKSGVIALTLGTERINGLKGDTIPVDGEPVVIGDGNVLGTATVLLAVMESWMITGTGGNAFGKLERAAELLARTVL